MDIGTLANVGTMLAVVVAVVFGIVQSRQNATRRREEAAAEMMRWALTPEFVRALDLVARLPDHAPLEIARGEDEHMARAIRHAVFTYESIGWTVYRRALDLHAVDELMGGTPRLAWRKLDAYVRAHREATASANFGEWFEWLVLQMNAHPVPWKAQGAHVALRDWSP